MITLFLLLLSVLALLAAALLHARRASAFAAADLAGVRSQLWQARRSEQQAIERLHAVADSALRGCPAVKWSRPQPVPAGADAFYWRIRVAGEELLLTDEQFRAARQRADHLLAPAAVATA